MNRSSFRIAIVILSTAAVAALTACSQDADTTSNVSAAQTASCVSVAQARATYDHEIQRANEALEDAYTAAKSQYDASVHQAEVTRDQKLAQLPENSTSDHSGDIENAIIKEFNDECAPGGPIDTAYQATCADAQKAFNATAKAAVDEYNASICL
jgi:hypothetical protein